MLVTCIYNVTWAWLPVFSVWIWWFDMCQWYVGLTSVRMKGWATRHFIRLTIALPGHHWCKDDVHPESLETKTGFCNNHPEKVISSSSHSRHAKSTVIDLGCGQGASVQEFLDDNFFTKVAGLDISLNALSRATAASEFDRKGVILSKRRPENGPNCRYWTQLLLRFSRSMRWEVLEFWRTHLPWSNRAPRSSSCGRYESLIFSTSAHDFWSIPTRHCHFIHTKLWIQYLFPWTELWNAGKCIQA